MVGKGYLSGVVTALRRRKSPQGRQLPFFSVLVPFWLVAAQAGWRGMKAVWPACLVAGGTFGLVQFLVSNLHGPWLVDIVAGAASMLAVVVLMRFWRPAKEQSNPAAPAAESAQATGPRWKAWVPWVLLSVFVFLWGLPAVKSTLNGWFAPQIPVPLLHNAVLKVPPVAPAPTPEKAIFSLNLLSATGTAIFIAALISMLVLKMKPAAGVKALGETVVELKRPIYSIGMVLAFAFVANYSGLSATLALLLAGTGSLFPFFSPFLGWLGVFLTGSDTSSNALF